MGDAGVVLVLRLSAGVASHDRDCRWHVGLFSTAKMVLISLRHAGCRSVGVCVCGTRRPLSELYQRRHNNESRRWQPDCIDHGKHAAPAVESCSSEIRLRRQARIGRHNVCGIGHWPGWDYRIGTVGGDEIGAPDSGDRTPGTGEPGYEINIPAAAHQGRETRSAEVRNEIRDYASAGKWPQRVSEEPVTAHTLLAKALKPAHRQTAVTEACDALNRFESPSR